METETCFMQDKQELRVKPAIRYETSQFCFSMPKGNIIQGFLHNHSLLGLGDG